MNMRLRHPRRRRRGPRGRGFTLVEAVATMTIISIIAAAGSRLVFTASQGFADAAGRAELSAAASAAMERLTQEIREIELRPSATPAEPCLDSVTESSIAWAGDRAVGLSGSTLTLTINGSARTLAEHVSEFTIRTYDHNDAELAESLSGDACDAVRRVQITLSLTTGGVTETLRTKVFLRGMMAGGAP